MLLCRSISTIALGSGCTPNGDGVAFRILDKPTTGLNVIKIGNWKVDLCPKSGIGRITAKRPPKRSSRLPRATSTILGAVA